jgi:hypothetical protein
MLVGLQDVMPYELTPKCKDPNWDKKKRRRKIAKRDRRFNRRKYSRKRKYR